MTLPAPTPEYSALYSAYVSGSLDPAFALLVETQAALRQDVRTALEISEVVASAQFEAAPPVAMREDALERALSAIDALEDTSPAAAIASPPFFSISDAARSAKAPFKSLITSRAPSAANRRTTARPMP